MKPTLKTVDFTSNENGTNSYFYMKNNKMLVQYSWQTCRPRPHFYTRVGLVDKSLWNCYPIENSYDWFYDYHTHDIRLGSVKYHKMPRSVKALLDTGVIRFDQYTKIPTRNLIGKRNAHIIKILHNLCKLNITLNPTKSIIKDDNNKLNYIIDVVHRKDDERKIAGKYTHTNPFSLNLPKDDIIMQLCGLGFVVLGIMRKIYRAKEKYYDQRKRDHVVTNW